MRFLLYFLYINLRDVKIKGDYVEKLAGIVINNDSTQLDRLFTYRIPERLEEQVKVGCRVKVPFGKGNKNIDGFVLKFMSEEAALLGKQANLKEILELCDSFTVLRETDIALIEAMRGKYLCTYLEGVKSIIPTGLIQGVKNKTSEMIYIGKSLNGKYNKEPYITIFETVGKNNGMFTKAGLSKNFNLSISSINSLLKYGFLSQMEVVFQRFNDREYRPYDAKILNEEQREIVDGILNSRRKLFLIHGVTGSGKTEIYMHLVKKMLEEGKEAIILVPEISLTPQMVERFKGRFGKEIAVFHSKLSVGERFDEWVRVKEGKVKVAVGARSAIFLPFQKLGMIIIDEEHENSYKSESDPKYHAREIAELKSNMEGCKVVLGSATPAIETYYRSLTGEIQLYKIHNRADGAVMPQSFLIDMRDELAEGNKSIFSRALYQGIKECLDKKEQAILFLNRRGFSTFVSCRKCGFVFKCRRCDISLTYHFEDGSLQCHYCGGKHQKISICPHCRTDKYVKYFGVGTEKIEEETKRYFPQARILRMDLDTTRKKDAYENMYTLFKNHNADILVGTQMIAKGLDFKNVTLVGVIAADLSLNLPDYRSTEKTFQLITQVSGRAGRGDKEGKVIVQTYNPDNYSIKCSLNHDYDSFFNEEIHLRQDMYYPPFSKILLIQMSSPKEALLIKNIQNTGILLKSLLEKFPKIQILGPCACSIARIKDFYRWQILIKGEISNELGANIKDIVYQSIKEDYNDIRVSIDINPNSLL